jgi:hypothetical protein
MNQKIAINLFARRSFGLAVRKASVAPRTPSPISRKQRYPGACLARDRVCGKRIALAKAAENELLPVDALGTLTGDGMWVGAGGVSFLPVRRHDGRRTNSANC